MFNHQNQGVYVSMHLAAFPLAAWRQPSAEVLLEAPRVRWARWEKTQPERRTRLLSLTL